VRGKRARGDNDEQLICNVTLIHKLTINILHGHVFRIHAFHFHRTLRLVMQGLSTCQNIFPLLYAQHYHSTSHIWPIVWLKHAHVYTTP